MIINESMHEVHKPVRRPTYPSDEMAEAAATLQAEAFELKYLFNLLRWGSQLNRDAQEWTGAQQGAAGGVVSYTHADRR